MRNSFFCKIALICFLISLYTVGHLYAHDGIKKSLNQFNLEHWTTENGLPDNAVIHSLLSKSGYIWFVSYGGISRFNGRTFKNFNSYNHPKITNNSFTHIYEDKEGAIWASSSGGGLARIVNDSLTLFSIEDGLLSNFVEEVVQDKKGRLWVATSDGLCYWENGRFRNDLTPPELKKKRLKSLDVDEKGNVWLATTNEGLFVMREERVVRIINESDGLLSNTINYVKYDDKRVWIGTEEGLTIISENYELENVTVADGLPHKVVSCSLVDSETGAVFIGTFKGIVRMVDGKIDVPAKSSQLYNNDFTNIIRDNENNFWISTYRKGLFKLWDGKFTNFSFSRAQIDYPYIVHTIFEKSTEGYYVVDDLGISELSLKNNTLLPLDIGHNFSDTKLKSGLLDSKNRLWIATGEYLLKYANGQYQKYNTENGLVFDNVRTIFEDSKQNIWVGTNSGISVIKPNGAIENFRSATSGLSHEYIMHFNEDAAGNILISTRNGLNIYDGESFTSYQGREGMAGDFVFKTYIDESGAIWLCGNAGLTRFKNGKFSHLTTQDGLASNTIFQILDDGLGNFWMTTNQKSITVFMVPKDVLNEALDGKTKRVSCQEFTEVDGLKANSATSSATSIKTDDGLLLFATNEGVELIDPVRIGTNSLKPPVVIERLTVDGNEININEPFELPPGKQRITIDFAALSFVASDKLLYEYKLEGFDDIWRRQSGNPTTSYTNLPPGDYVFKVKGANSDGVWNEEGATIAFSKRPSFTQTPAFSMLVIAGMIMIGFLIYSVRVRSLKRAQAELSFQVEERTSELVLRAEEIEAQNEEIEAQRKEIESKNHELQQVNTKLEDIVEQRTEQLKSTYKDLLDVNKELDTFIYRSVHDVRGPIARLQGLSHLISLETKDEKILELVKRLNLTADEMNAVFYRLLNIVRLKNTELNFSKIDLKALVDEVIFDLYNQKEEKVAVKVEVAADFNLYTDKNNLNLILFQLVDNAMKFSNGSDMPEVKIEASMMSPKVARITVSDKGQGIAKDVADKIFEMFFVGQDYMQGAGLGLYAVKTAVKVLKGEVKLLKSKPGDTIFEITLPSNA